MVHIETVSLQTLKCPHSSVSSVFFHVDVDTQQNSLMMLRISLCLFLFLCSLLLFILYKCKKNKGPARDQQGLEELKVPHCSHFGTLLPPNDPLWDFTQQHFCGFQVAYSSSFSVGKTTCISKPSTSHAFPFFFLFLPTSTSCLTQCSFLPSPWGLQSYQKASVTLPCLFFPLLSLLMEVNSVKINHQKLNNLVPFSMFIILFNHHLCLVPKYFQHSSFLHRNIPSKQLLSIFPFPSP